MESVPVDWNHSQAETATPLSATARRVYRVLSEKISEGEFRPGDRLIEDEVARFMGVSRSPVREAFARLEADGFVASKRFRGTYVAAQSARRRTQIIEFRIVLEEFAVRRLAEPDNMVTLVDLEQHAVVINEAAKRFDLDATLRAETLFHRALVAAAQNEPLNGSYLWLDKEFQASTRLAVTDVRGLARLTDEHDAILAAIRDRDADRAASVLRAHLLVPIIHAI
jgi:DNA-binding GntR family transcriptional regulator